MRCRCGTCKCPTRRYWFTSGRWHSLPHVTLTLAPVGQEHGTINDDQIDPSLLQQAGPVDQTPTICIDAATMDVLVQLVIHLYYQSMDHTKDPHVTGWLWQPWRWYMEQVLLYKSWMWALHCHRAAWAKPVMANPIAGTASHFKASPKVSPI